MGDLVGGELLLDKKVSGLGWELKTLTKGRKFGGLGAAHDGQQIYLPGWTWFIEIEKMKPGEGLSSLGQDMVESAVNFQVGFQVWP